MSQNKITIIPYKPRYLRHFIALNLEWLEAFFYVEDHDREVLEQAEKYILDKGGYIFFAVDGQKVLGTVALINEVEGLELSKMAVDKNVRGRGIGQLLLEHCIAFAMDQGWSKVHLYSNRKLTNAIHIYKKYGFKEIEMKDTKPYARGDIKMKLDLTKV